MKGKLTPKSEILRDIKQIVEGRKQREDKKIIEAPLTQVETIQNRRTLPGEGKLWIGGIPVDVFSIEDMIIKVSPADVKTLMRLDSSRTIEMMKNNVREYSEKRGNVNWGLLMLILAIGAGVFLFIYFVLPSIGGIFGG